MRPGDTRGIASDIHHDVLNTRTVINNIHNMLKCQEAAGYKLQLVSVTRILSFAEYIFTVA